MAQETNTFETRNGVAGFFGGLGDIVKSVVPLAADVYSLKAQGQLLKNQSAGELAKLQLEAAKLKKEAEGLSGGSGMSGLPAWVRPVAIGGGILLIVLIIIRSMQRK